LETAEDEKLSIGITIIRYYRTHTTTTVVSKLSTIYDHHIIMIAMVGGNNLPKRGYHRLNTTKPLLSLPPDSSLTKL